MIDSAGSKPAQGEGSSLPAMIFYQKPVLGPTGLKQNRGNEPYSVTFPSGTLGLGLPASNGGDSSVWGDNAGGLTNVTIASGPEESMMDIRERRIIIFTFLVVCVVNFVVTCILYFDAISADLIDLDNPQPMSSNLLQHIPPNRSFLERVNFGFTLFILIYGAVSVAFENPLGISVYALAISLNFILGISAIPYFLYALRYFLDTWMLYLALILRSRLVLSFLPFHIPRTDRNR